MPGSASVPPRRAATAVRLQPRACREAQATPSRFGWFLFVLGAAVALGGCLQDAYNTNNGFSFNNPVDPTTVSAGGVVIASISFLGNTGNDQIVVIVNGSGTVVNMQGWILVNTSTLTTPPAAANTYTFATFSLSTGGFVRVHSLAGTDTGTDLYGGPTWFSTNLAELEEPGGVGAVACMVGSPVC